MPNESIHPRVQFRDGVKKNTCAPRNPNRKGKLAKKQARLGARRVAHAETLRKLPSNVNPASYKSPGSMNARK
jgi:hypothetical protein